MLHLCTTCAVFMITTDIYHQTHLFFPVSQVSKSTLVHGIQYDPVISCHLGPISHRDHELINKIMWKYNYFHIRNNHPNRSKFCACHNSWAVVTCAKLWPDHIIRIKVRVKIVFSKIFMMSSWIVSKIGPWPYCQYTSGLIGQITGLGLGVSAGAAAYNTLCSEVSQITSLFTCKNECYSVHKQSLIHIYKKKD